MPTNNLKYVGLNPIQIQFGRKNLLYSEMELLTGAKHLKSYKNLRKKEFAIKNLLKKVIIDINKEIKKISEYFPEVSNNEEPLRITKSIKKRDTLDKEILELQQKIAEL